MKRYTIILIFMVAVLGMLEGSSFGKQNVALLLTFAPEIINNDRAAIQEELYTQFTQTNRYSLIKPETLTDFFQKSAPEYDSAYNVGKEYLKNGKEMFDLGKWDDALMHLEMARSSFMENPKSQNADFIETDLYLAQIFLFKGDKTQAGKYFQEMIVCNGDYEIDANIYSPDIVDSFKQNKEIVKTNATRTLQVISEPSGALVKLYGREMGNAPLEIANIGPGEYVLELSKLGYLSELQKVSIRENDVTKEVTISLKTSVSGKDLKNTMEQLLQKPDEEKIAFARMLNHALNTTYTYIAEVQLYGMHYLIRIYKIPADAELTVPNREILVKLSLKELKREIFLVTSQLENAKIEKNTPKTNQTKKTSEAALEYHDELILKPVEMQTDAWYRKWCFL
jgi:tetratricopeptide (TPR) repeat protein